MEIIQSILFNKNDFTKKECIKWLKEHDYKFNDFDNSKPHFFHWRQSDPKKLEEEGYIFKTKKITDGIEFVIAYKMSGGAIGALALNKFIKASYHPEMNDDIDGYKKIKSLSNSEITTFYNGSHCVAVFRGTEKTLTDWSNNIAYIAGQYENTNRFKRAKEMYKKIVDKYGEKNISLVGHSQSAVITRKIGENAKEIINVNPSWLGEPEKKNEYNVRSSLDIPSALKGVVNSVKGLFGKDDKNITIENKTLNPLTEHSSDILQRLPEDTIIGGFLKFGELNVKIPPLFNITKSGMPKEVKGITPTGQLTTRNGKKAIKIKIIDGDEAKIEKWGDRGRYIQSVRDKKSEIKKSPKYQKIQKEITELSSKRPQIIQYFHNKETGQRTLKYNPEDWDSKDYYNWLNTKDGKKVEYLENKLKKMTKKWDIENKFEDKTKFNSIVLDVPKMEFETKTGITKIIDPVLKTGNLTTRQGKKSIKLSGSEKTYPDVKTLEEIINEKDKAVNKIDLIKSSLYKKDGGIKKSLSDFTIGQYTEEIEHLKKRLIYLNSFTSGQTEKDVKIKNTNKKITIVEKPKKPKQPTIIENKKGQKIYILDSDSESDSESDDKIEIIKPKK